MRVALEKFASSDVALTINGIAWARKRKDNVILSRHALRGMGVFGISRVSILGNERDLLLEPRNPTPGKPCRQAFWARGRVSAFPTVPMAFFIFLPTTARTKLISTDFFHRVQGCMEPERETAL